MKVTCIYYRQAANRSFPCASAASNFDLSLAHFLAALISWRQLLAVSRSRLRHDGRRTDHKRKLNFRLLGMRGLFRLESLQQLRRNRPKVARKIRKIRHGEDDEVEVTGEVARPAPKASKARLHRTLIRTILRTSIQPPCHPSINLLSLC